MAFSVGIRDGALVDDEGAGSTGFPTVEQAGRNLLLEVDLQPPDDKVAAGGEHGLPCDAHSLGDVGVAGLEEQLGDRQIVQVHPVVLVGWGGVLDETVSGPGRIARCGAHVPDRFDTTTLATGMRICCGAAARRAAPS